MALGLGHLQIQPQQFWRMTPRELFAAADGYMRRMGVDPDKIVEPITKREVEEWFANYEREQAELAEQQQAVQADNPT